MTRNIWIGIVVVAMLVAGGWWYLNQSSAPTTSGTQPVVNNQPTQPAQTSPTPSTSTSANQPAMRIQLLGLTSKNQTALPVLRYHVDGNVQGNGYVSIVSKNSGATIWGMEQEPSGTHDIDLNTLTAIDGSPVKIADGDYFLRVQDKFADDTGDTLVACTITSKCIAESATFHVAPGVMGN